MAAIKVEKNTNRVLVIRPLAVDPDDIVVPETYDYLASLAQGKQLYWDGKSYTTSSLPYPYVDALTGVQQLASYTGTDPYLSAIATIAKALLGGKV